MLILLCPVGLFVYKARVRMLKTQAAYAANKKRKGEEAHLQSALQGLPQWCQGSRRCACMQAPVQIGALSHAWQESGLFFRGQKKKAEAAWHKTIARLRRPLFLSRPFFSLLFLSLFSLSLSLSLSLHSLSLSLSFSLSPSLSFKGTHTHTRIVEPKPNLLVGPLPLHPVTSSWIG